MDLFHMKRYWSEDGDLQQFEKLEADGCDGNDILDQLKEKARKKSHKPQNHRVVGKPKGDDRADGEPPSRGDEAAGAEVPKSKKRKRKKAEAGAENGSGFTVLGEDLCRARSKVRRVLPHWLANPDIVSVDLSDNQMAVAELEGLDLTTVNNLKANHISHFFPVQRQLIPYMLRNETSSLYRPNDVCVSAPTGSGKTISFVIPIVQALRDRTVPKIRALVILPVQDLAAQVHKVFLQFCKGTPLKAKLLSGQKPFKQEQAELVKPDTAGGFHSLADIVVATPGRTVDHIMKTEGFSLRALRFLIVDEADRVMEDVQNDWLNHVENAVFSGGRRRPGPLTVANCRQRDLPLQKLLFSATLSQNPEKLEQMNLFEPKLFTSIVQPKDIRATASGRGEQGQTDRFVGKYTTPSELSEVVVKVKDNLNKPMILESLISSNKMRKVLIFSKSTENAHALMILLKQYGHKAGELSSKVREKRSKILNQFNRGQIDLLVCTDALARGIDIGEIDHVVSYDCPRYIKPYIHRVGRTARAGRKGTAITLVGKNEEKMFQQMMKEAGKEANVREEAVNDDNLDLNAYDRAKERATVAIRSEREKTPKGRRPKKKLMAEDNS